MSETKLVYQAIAAVAAALTSQGISKDRKNAQQNYSFRGIDDVLNSVAPLYVEHGLIVLPSYSERTVSERETKSGGVLFSVTVTGNYTLVSAKDGSFTNAGPFYGEAMDSADKATNKAMSAAYKYFAIQTFNIPTEGDNDADTHTHNIAPKKQPQPVQQLASAPSLAAATVADYCADMESATTLMELQKKFANAIEAAAKANDVTAKLIFVSTKDDMKTKLKA